MQIDLNQVGVIGSGLIRPEGVMALDDNTILAADARGCVARISPEGVVSLTGDLGGAPNGICVDRNSDVLVANIGNGQLQRLKPDGSHEVLLTELEGRCMRAPNFPFMDHKGRLWVTNSTEHEDVDFVLHHPRPDGCIFLIAADGTRRIVADGLFFANGLALDAAEEYVYVAETMTCRVLRFRILPDNSLGPAEPYGPDHFGLNGFPDGIAFDSAGNLWTTFPVWNAIGLITAEGNFLKVLEDPQGRMLRRPSNICFGGKDLKTAYIGSLGGSSICHFKVPYAGMRLVHQSL